METSPSYEFASAIAKQQVESGMVAGMGNQAFQPATRRQILELKKQRLQMEMKLIDDAINALDSHPELEEFLNTLARANL